MNTKNKEDSNTNLAMFEKVITKQRNRTLALLSTLLRLKIEGILTQQKNESLKIIRSHQK